MMHRHKHKALLYTFLARGQLEVTENQLVIFDRHTQKFPGSAEQHDLSLQRCLQLGYLKGTGKLH